MSDLLKPHHIGHLENHAYSVLLDRDLHRSCLRACDLTGCVFRNCDLRGCEFDGACLRSAVFVDCKLVGSTWHGTEARAITIIGSDCERTDFSGAELAFCMVACSRLHWARFWRAGLQDAVIINCNGPAFHLRSDLSLLEEIDGQGRIHAYRWETREGSWRGAPKPVGTTHISDLNKMGTRGCAPGLHAATLDWCVDVAMEETGWDGMAPAPFDVLETISNPRDLFVPYTRGRFRSSKMTIKRVVPEGEWRDMLEVAV